jgi:hypothetical protein
LSKISNLVITVLVIILSLVNNVLHAGTLLEKCLEQFLLLLVVVVAAAASGMSIMKSIMILVSKSISKIIETKRKIIYAILYNEKLRIVLYSKKTVLQVVASPTLLVFSSTNNNS